MAMNKKGFFYTITALLLISVIFISSSLYISYNERNKAMLIETRVQTMNSFVKDISHDMEKGFYITSFRALLGLTQYVIDNGTYIDDSIARFEEAFFYGTVDSVNLEIMKGQTFTDWIYNMKYQAELIGLELNITVINLTVSQSDPWSVNTFIVTKIDVSDSKKTSYWTKTQNVSTSVSIIGFEDVMYTLESYGRIYFQAITPTDVEYFRDPVTNDTSGLETHLNTSMYMQSDDAPSFLMRLEGKKEPDVSGNGIESLAYKPNFDEVDAPYFTSRSSIDFMQFDDINQSVCTILGMPSWFRLRSSEVSRYDVEGLETCE